MIIGIWNIRGLRTKQKEILDEIRAFKMDTAALNETKKKGIGSEYLDDSTHLNSGVNKTNRAKTGVSLLMKNRLARNIKN